MSPRLYAFPNSLKVAKNALSIITISPMSIAEILQLSTYKNMANST